MIQRVEGVRIEVQNVERGETSQKYVSGGTKLFEILALKPQIIK